MAKIITKYKSTVGSKFKLSPSLHRKSIAPNTNTLKVSDFFSRNLERKDLGFEVGSLNYVEGSNYYFIRTKALQQHSYLPEISSESVMNIHPNSFRDYNLKEGDIIISKDSNIGEVVILDKDYPNYMLSGALYCLPIKDRKYYLLAFLKHSFFRNQLDMLVPKGATIRHAGNKFLDCNIPLPNKNTSKVIEYVETLMKSIFLTEKAIKNKFGLINDLIKRELIENRCQVKFNFEQPHFKDLVEKKRLDTGTYSKCFKTIDFLIRNYKHGYSFIEPTKLKSGNTPIVRYIGTESFLKYRWITPSNCSDVGYISIDERINMLGSNNNLNQNAMLLVNRTSRGGKGEYVGIAAYYDLNIYGKGHHNQGIYRVFDYNNDDLIFMTCFMNTHLMRKYCSHMCVGSKMKELKASQFLTIPFPNFQKNIKSQIVTLYNNPLIDFKNVPIKDIVSYFDNAGLIQLELLLRDLKNRINNTIDSIINDVDILIE